MQQKDRLQTENIKAQVYNDTLTHPHQNLELKLKCKISLSCFVEPSEQIFLMLFKGSNIDKKLLNFKTEQH